MTLLLWHFWAVSVAKQGAEHDHQEPSDPSFSAADRSSRHPQASRITSTRRVRFGAHDPFPDAAAGEPRGAGLYEGLRDQLPDDLVVYHGGLQLGERAKEGESDFLVLTNVYGFATNHGHCRLTALTSRLTSSVSSCLPQI